MSEVANKGVEQTEALLRLIMPDQFRVIYTPDMPEPTGKPARWFQVVFAVGPGDTAVLRAQVHALFPQMLSQLSKVRLATEADLVSLRARRFCPDTKILDPAHPVMFVESYWTASAFRTMQRRGDFSTWARESVTYRNHFDQNDPLTKQYDGRPIT